MLNLLIVLARKLFAKKSSAILNSAIWVTFGVIFRKSLNMIFFLQTSFCPQ